MQSYFNKTASAAVLANFRMLFGILIFFGLIRFWAKGWIAELYIDPAYYFPYYGFEFVKPLGEYTYALFGFCLVMAFLVTIGFVYRLAIVGLFLSFTYIELIDKSTYLNHYYFVSLVCFLLIFLPAHSYFSIDSIRSEKIRANRIPRWCVDAVKLMVFILYLYAGLAKLNSDWLFEGLPLRIWLPAKNDLPLVGSLFNHAATALAFSWFGCFYDLTIVFFLGNRKTRLMAFITVIVFHLTTAVLFPIGMFPYVMVMATTIFFSEGFHQTSLRRLGSLFKVSFQSFGSDNVYQFPKTVALPLKCFLVIFFTFQLLFPWRYLMYPGELFWTEEGYRFSWRVMLLEKAGYAQFTVIGQSGNSMEVNNNQFLTRLQEKMMSTQPDMIVQYAHMLSAYYSKRGFEKPEVYIDSYVSLNGRLGRPLIDPKTDLAKVSDSFSHKFWILPLADEIKGL